MKAGGSVCTSNCFKIYFSITICIQHNFVLVSDVEQLCILQRVPPPRFLQYPPDTAPSYHSIIDRILCAGLHIPVTSVAASLCCLIPSPSSPSPSLPPVFQNGSFLLPRMYLIMQCIQLQAYMWEKTEPPLFSLYKIVAQNHCHMQNNQRARRE